MFWILYLVIGILTAGIREALAEKNYASDDAVVAVFFAVFWPVCVFALLIRFAVKGVAYIIKGFRVRPVLPEPPHDHPWGSFTSEGL